MQNKYTTLNDVKKFMKSKVGKSWNCGVYWDGKYVDVDSFNQLATMGVVSPVFVGDGWQEPTYFKVSTTKFLIIDKQLNDYYDGYTYDVEADYSAEWMKYQCDKYGDEFRFFCLDEIEVDRLKVLKKLNEKKQKLLQQIAEVDESARKSNDEYAVLKSEISTTGLKK